MRKHLFLATCAITVDAAEFFGLPRDRTVIVGSPIVAGARTRPWRLTSGFKLLSRSR
jgi:hypothetical protein